jgi:hypothetical protein
VNERAGYQIDERVAQEDGDVIHDVPRYKSTSQQCNCFTVLILLLQARRWEHCVLTGGLFAVDTFLTLSGVLLCYIFMVTMSKKGKFNLIIYFLHRYMR